MIEVSRAKLSDLGELRPKVRLRTWSGIVLQVMRSRARTFRHDGRVLAVAGLYPDPRGEWLEAWFVPSPDLRGTREAAAVIRAAARLVAAEAGPVPISAGVFPGNATGERIARLMGFRPDGELIEGVLNRFTVDAESAGVASGASGQPGSEARI